MILTENEESSSSRSKEVIDAEGPTTMRSSSPTAPPSYVPRNGYVATNDKTPAFGDESGNPASSSMSTSFYASPAIAGPSDPGRSQQDDDGSSLFSRVPPRELSYSSFQPMYLLCKGKTLDKGFPRAPPPSSIQPHPFNSHDITEGDWWRFVEAVYLAANLTDKDVRRSYKLPIVSIVPIINDLSAMGVQKIMKNRKVHKVAKLIDTWNHHFFEPRKMRVVLMKGETKLNGLTEPPLAPPPPPANLSAARDIAKNKDSEPSSSHHNDDNYRLFVVSL